jgi:hypothetical protein
MPEEKTTMTSTSRAWLMHALSVGLIIAGVAIGGSEQNAMNLFMAYMLPAAVIQGLGKRMPLWIHALSAVVLGLCIFMAASTLGPGHATSPWAALVYIGLVGSTSSQFAFTQLTQPVVDKGGEAK